MAFPAGTGIDTDGDMSGSAWNADGTALIEWGAILENLGNAIDPVTNSLNVGAGPTTVSGLVMTKTTIHYNDASPVTLTTTATNTILTDVIVVATTAWNGTTPSIDIGTIADADGILPNASITKTLNAVSGEDVTTRGVDLYASSHAKLKFYAAATAIRATIAITDTSAGVADVYLIWAHYTPP
jgi:hypothetical protein